MIVQKFDLKDLAEFLVEAKKNAWAGDSGEVEPTRPGFKRHLFKKGEWEYDDEYTGFYCAPGTEIASYQGKRVWAMAYDGGMREQYWGNTDYAKYIFSHLKKALLEVPLDKPFRGPKMFVDGDLTYHFEVEGDIKRFTGRECITDDNGELFEPFRQNFIGGLIVSK